MSDVDVFELVAWNAAISRARMEYALNPITSFHVSGPCLTGCGRPTRCLSGFCRECVPARKTILEPAS